MIILSADDALKVRGQSPIDTCAAIEPRLLKTGSFALNEGVIADPAHGDIAEFLNGLEKRAVLASEYETAAATINALPKWRDAGRRKEPVPPLPSFDYPSTTGGDAGTLVEAADAVSLRAAVNLDSPNRRIVIPDTTTGILKLGSVKSKSDNLTVEGHEKVFVRLPNSAWEVIKGENVIFRKLAMGAWNDPVTINEIDSLLVGFQATGPVKNVVFDQCPIALSNDELARVRATAAATHKPEGVLFYRCPFLFPLYDASHPEGADHNLGPAASDYAKNVGFVECFMWGLRTRCPQIGTASVVYSVNNVIGLYGLRATNIVGSRNSLAEAVPGTSSWVAGNLYVHGSRAQTIWLHNINGAIQHHCVQVSGDFPNHFVKPATDDFTDDRIEVGNGITIDNCSNDPLKTEPGFLINGLTPQPTRTEAQRRALWARVLDNMPGHKFVQDVVAQARLGQGEHDVTPARIKELYGDDLSGMVA